MTPDQQDSYSALIDTEYDTLMGDPDLIAELLVKYKDLLADEIIGNLSDINEVIKTLISGEAKENVDHRLS